MSRAVNKNLRRCVISGSLRSAAQKKSVKLKDEDGMNESTVKF